jgi:2-succinyl-6-hydroxy-2,4-cyclohexadiene-1-carboxylate synthase
MKVSQIVAFHGFMGVGADFIPLVERLGMSVYTPDLIGHGTFQSDNPLDYTLDTQLSYWAEHLPDRCTLVGYSMGGRLALQLALRYPKRIERLVLIGATPGLVDPKKRTQRVLWDREQAQSIRSLGVKRFYEEWQKIPIIATQQTIEFGIREAMMANRMTQSVEGLALSMEYFGTGVMPHCWDILHTLSVPTLLMVGERDLKYREIAESMIEQLVEGPVDQVVIPKVGHCAHLEGLDKATEHLRHWLTLSVCGT